MKRKLIVLMAMLMAAVSPTWAHINQNGVPIETDGVTLYYNLYSDGHAEVGYNTTYNNYNSDGYNFSGESLVIPETVDHSTGTYNVTAIAGYAFYYNSSEKNETTTSITIPNSVKSIGSNVVCYMSNLSTLYFNVESGCSISSGAFTYLNSSCNLVLGGNVKEYPGNIVYKSDPTTISIPAQITKLGNNAFNRCYNLKAVTCEEGSLLTEIGDYAFMGDYKLTSIQIPNSVTTIGRSAFNGCTALTTLNIPTDLQTLGVTAFYNCSKLTSLTIPSGVTSIEDNVFEGCSGLTSLVLPSTVTKIGTSAFKDCSSLTSLTLPSGFNSIGNTAFKNCSSLKDLKLPSGVTKIGTYAFENCSALESIEIPNTVTEIGQYAFYDCSSLTEMTIPNSVTSLGNNFLDYCNNLKTLFVLTTTAPTISNSTLWGASVENVYVREVALGSFISNNKWNNNRTFIPLSNIKYTTTDGQTVTPDENLSFGEGVELVASVYDGGEEGNRFGYLEFKGAVKEIPAEAFKDMPLTGIMLPSTVEEIGDDAFSGCSGLNSLVLFSKTAPTVSSSAFSGATSLSEVYVREIASSGYGSVWQGKQVKTLANIKYTTSDGKYLEPKVITGYGENVTYLTSIYDGGEEGSEFGYLEFKGSPTKIPEEAFYNKHNLTSIDLPNTVESIGNSAFYYCNSLTEIMIPSGVTSIGGHTFQYCTSLKEVTLPSGITRVNEYMFWNCTSLKTLNVLTQTAPDLGSSVFYNVPADMVINVREIALRSFANAYDWEDYTQKQLPNIKYYTSDEEALGLTELSGYGEDVTFLGDFNDGGEEGNRFGYLEFKGNVTTIPAEAFSGMTALTGIMLPNKVEEIGADAFSGCENLNTLVLFSKTAPSVSSSAFTGATSLSEVYVREMARHSYGTGDTWEGKTIKTLKSIKYTTSDGKIIFPNDEDYGKNSIAPNTTAAYGENVKLVGNFYDGDNCGYLEFKGTLAKIPAGAFYNKKTITAMELPNGLNRIEDRAFNSCSSLTELIVPSTVTWMDYSLFDGCTNFKSLYVLTNSAPNGSTYLFENAPTGLQIYVREIAKSKFESAYIWQNQTFNQLPNIKYTTSEDKALGLIPLSGYGENVKLLGSFYDGGEEGNRFGYLEFKVNPTAIPNEAFKQTALSSIDLPADVTTIGEDAFDGCTMTGVTYGGELADWSAIDFGNAAANPLSGMTAGQATVKNSEGVAIIPTALEITGTAVKPYTFVNSNIETLNLGSVETIGDGAFSGCSSLAEINVSTDEPATLGEDAFKGINENHAVNVFLNSYFDYKKANGWKDLNLTPQSGMLALNDEIEYTIGTELTNCTLSYTRTVTSDNWMGVYLPFDVDVTKIEGTYATLKSVSEGYLNWETQENGTIAACTPFIFKPTEAGPITFSATAATLHSCLENNAVIPAEGYKLDGTFTTKDDMKAIKGYALKDGNFYYTNDPTKTLKPYRIFLTIPETQEQDQEQEQEQSPIRSRINGEDITGIEGIEYAECGTLNPGFGAQDGMYNLNGQRVGADYKGIVIVNGKKVMRK